MEESSGDTHHIHARGHRHGSPDQGHNVDIGRARRVPGPHPVDVLLQVPAPLLPLRNRPRTLNNPDGKPMELGTEQLRQSNLLSTRPRIKTITHITASQTQPTNNSDVVAPDFLQAELISKLVPNLAQGPEDPSVFRALGLGDLSSPGNFLGVSRPMG